MAELAFRFLLHSISLSAPSTKKLPGATYPGASGHKILLFNYTVTALRFLRRARNPIKPTPPANMGSAAGRGVFAVVGVITVSKFTVQLLVGQPFVVIADVASVGQIHSALLLILGICPGYKLCQTVELSLFSPSEKTVPEGEDQLPPRLPVQSVVSVKRCCVPFANAKFVSLSEKSPIKAAGPPRLVAMI